MIDLEDDNENPGECECCGFQTTKLEFFKGLDTTIAGGGKTRKDDFWYCELCVSTPASNAHRYPGQYSGQQETLRAVCYVGNAILTALAGLASDGEVSAG